IPFKDVDCAVYVGVHYGAAVLIDIETSMHTAGLVSCATPAASLARVRLFFCDYLDASESCFVREKIDDCIERPLVEVLISAVSPVFVISDPLEVPHDDRGDTASLCI